MAPPARQFSLPVPITRWISDEPQPGWVEADLIDAHGRTWLFWDKPPCFTRSDLSAQTSYPHPGKIACNEISRRQNPQGQWLVLIDTDKPWGIESVEQATQFEVFASQLTEITE